MTFKENLLKKIEIDRLAARVSASCGPPDGSHRVNKEAMRRLLEISPYTYQHERDLDLYVKEVEGEPHKILVLDNELPIFRSTVKDVVTRRSPLTLELWSIRTIRRILVDSDIKESVRGESVATVARDTIELFDLSYTDADIEALAIDGMAWLAGRDADGVETTLTMFAELLGYQKPPRPFKLDHLVCYGAPAAGPDKDAAFGPLVFYRPAANTLFWLDKKYSRGDQEQLDFLRKVAAGQAAVPTTGDAVFRRLKTEVLGRTARGLSI